MDVQSKKSQFYWNVWLTFHTFCWSIKKILTHQKKLFEWSTCVRLSVNMMSLCVFVGALQYTGSQGGNIQAASWPRAADFGHDPWGSRQHHRTGPAHLQEKWECVQAKVTERKVRVWFRVASVWLNLISITGLLVWIPELKSWLCSCSCAIRSVSGCALMRLDGRFIFTRAQAQSEL